MNWRQYFTEEEARALVGHRVRLSQEWSGLPSGTLGQVIDVNEGLRGWTAVVELSTGEERVMDWLSRNEFRRGIIRFEGLPPVVDEPSVFVRRARVASGLSLRKFALLLGVSRETVRRWEAGKLTPPPQVLQTIVELYKRCTAELSE